MIGPGSTQHAFTNSTPVSASCSLALATAERTTLSISTAARFLLKLSIASASSTGRPRIRSITSRALRGAMRANRCFAVNAVSLTSIASVGCASAHQPSGVLKHTLQIQLFRGCWSGSTTGPCFGCLSAAVAAENSRRREFTQLVADHVFLHEHADKFVAVVHFESVADKL